MSDLSDRLEALARKPLDERSERSQLSVTTYFSDELFRRELELIFQHGPRYLGHELAVPEMGDYHALPQEGEGRALVRTANGVELLSNVCRHRQALMLRGRGNTRHTAPGHSGGNIVCPLHRWTYNTNGELIGAPHFAESPCLHLNNYKTRSWNGLVFEGRGRDIAADLAPLGPLPDFDFSGKTQSEYVEILSIIAAQVWPSTSRTNVRVKSRLQDSLGSGAACGMASCRTGVRAEACCTYASDVKHEVLGVSPGPVVSERAAIEMAEGARRVLGSDVGLALTGVAGPAEQDGQPGLAIALTVLALNLVGEGLNDGLNTRLDGKPR
mgnify:CR=1 FL=1